MGKCIVIAFHETDPRSIKFSVGHIFSDDPLNKRRLLLLGVLHPNMITGGHAWEILWGQTKRNFSHREIHIWWDLASVKV